jgi:hypothetical protein
MTKRRRFFRLLFCLPADIIVTFPVLFAYGILLVPGTAVFSWFLWISVFYLAGFTAGVFRKQAIQITAAGIFVLLAVFGQLITRHSLIFILMTFVPGALALLRGYKLLNEEDADNLFPTLYFISGPLLYFFSFIFYYIVPQLKIHLSFLVFPGTVSVLLFLAGEAYRRIKFSNISGNRIPGSISRRSTFTVMLTFLSILLLALLISAGISDVFLTDTGSALKWFVLRLTELQIFSRESPEKNDITDGEEIPEPELEKIPVGLNPFILRIRYIILFLVITVVLMMLYRFLKGKIHKKNKPFQFGAGKGFYDEIENLFSLKKFLRKKFLFTVKHDRYSVSDPVRRRYRNSVVRAVKKGYPFRKEHTPRETAQELNRWHEGPLLTEEFIREYEERRYK